MANIPLYVTPKAPEAAPSGAIPVDLHFTPTSEEFLKAQNITVDAIDGLGPTELQEALGDIVQRLVALESATTE